MKDAYYFSHDSNARYDPKILSMISVYGMAGYGWYWVIIEILREQENYKFKIVKEHSYNAIAMQMQCDCNATKKFIDDCIKEFELFVSDGEFFWSESLLNRMEILANKRQKMQENAAKRWGNQAQKMQKQCKSNAIALQTKCKSNASKVKESKVKESKVYIDLPGFNSIFTYWNSKQIITHKKLSDKAKTKIKVLLDDYSELEIKEAINNYWHILTGDEYWFNYKWTLDEFLQRGFEKFKDGDIAHDNYLRKDKK